MNCKNCQNELQEGVTLCPNCGTDNSPQEQPDLSVEETKVMTPEFSQVESAAQEASEEAVQEDAVATEEAPADAPKNESHKLSASKIALAVGGCVVLLALIVALIVGGLSRTDAPTDADSPESTTQTDDEEQTETQEPTIPEDGNPDDASCKGTYTASDEEVFAAADTVVASMEGAELTNAELQVYYSLMVNQFLNTDNFYYLYYYGMFDYTQPLDTQISAYAEDLTWQQYFVQEAINAWQLYQALALEAQSQNFELPAEHREYLDGLRATIEEDAAEAGYDSADAFIQANLNTCATIDNYLAFQEVYYLGYSYYQYCCDQIQPTDEEIEAYFTEHEAEYAENGLTKDYKLVDVRHILVMPDGVDSSTICTETFSDEAWEIAEKKAQEIYEAWLAGDATQDSFAQLAKENSADSSASDGGLIEDIAEGEMVESFENWCFDADRKEGDHGIVKSEFGYHIMYFVGEDYKWAEYTKSDIITEYSNSLIDNATQAHPIEVTYANMLLGTMNLGS